MSAVGIDIVEIERIQRAAARWGDSFLKRVFTDSELRLFAAKPASLAARFAAKEAVLKTLNARVFCYTDIEILSAPGGGPELHLHGRAKALAESRAPGGISISLSHEHRYAIAMALVT